MLRLRGVLAQRQVLGERERQHEAAPLAILGDVRDAGRGGRRDAACPVMSRPSIDDAPDGRVRRPVIASTSSLLAVASTPAIATISPPWTSSDMPSTAAELAVVADLEILDVEHRSPGGGGALATASSTSRPTISRARLALGRALGGDGVDLLAAAQHGDAVGDLAAPR